MDKTQIDKHIESSFQSLSPTLQRAARFALDHPNEIALESMRTVAAKAKLQPASMLRLARQLGFDSYEDFRQIYRGWLTERDSPFSRRADALRKRSHDDQNTGLIAEMLHTELGNLEETFSAERHAQILAAHALLTNAKHIYVVGLRSLFPAAYYFSYVCGMFLNNTTLLSGIGGSFADELRRIGPDDALVAFSYHPYAQDAQRAVQFSRERGAQVVAITDSPVSPIAAPADVLVVVRNSTPSLFPSVVPALAVSQTLAGLLVANSNEDSLREIANSEAQLKSFQVYIDKA
ncbi:MurR/RpiR family transcriptional regulator [Pseudomonas sp. SCB32]|uniref:MurR/RpiR family transcriptional regulator n=1 Tax=Pseudomonas sp. SCB32 TaxID=2653853 RepID=UPI001264D043|nr:MurR/RpiR family transcriptional regulator [Pseudomonas sp. SCB32]